MTVAIGIIMSNDQYYWLDGLNLPANSLVEQIGEDSVYITEGQYFLKYRPTGL